MAPEINEYVDQSPVVHPVGSVVSSTLYPFVFPITSRQIMTYQQPTTERRVGFRHKWPWPHGSKPLTPPGTLVAQELFKRSQRAYFRGFGALFQVRAPLALNLFYWLSFGYCFRSRCFICMYLLRLLPSFSARSFVTKHTRRSTGSVSRVGSVWPRHPENVRQETRALKV